MDASHILSILVLVVAVATGAIVTWRGLKEYYFQGVVKRVDLFVQMRLRY